MYIMYFIPTNKSYRSCCMSLCVTYTNPGRAMEKWIGLLRVFLNGKLNSIYKLRCSLH